MSVIGDWQKFSHPNKGNHPLVALFLFITFCIGLAHETRIVGDMLVILVRYSKEELTGLRDVAQRLKREFTTGEVAKPETKPAPPSSTQHASRGS
jgi:hypothetical protein